MLDKCLTWEVSAVAKTISKIGSREQRKKLAMSGKPHLEPFERGFDLGYRKGRRGGSWVIRRYLGRRDLGYTFETIGRADDDPAEPRALDYEAARAFARDRIRTLAEEARVASHGPVITVQKAIDEYVAARDARELASRQTAEAVKGLKKDARSRLKHVLANEKLAAKPLSSLTTDDLTTWRESLRMEAASVQRVVNDFKAALNAAAKRYRGQLPPTIRDAIKDGLATVNASAPIAREAQVLPDADVRRLIAGAWAVDADGVWNGDLGRLVLVLAATGARFSQVIRMTVGDVQPAQGRLMVPTSRKGRGTKRQSHTGVRVGADVLAALAPVTAGRKGSDPLFLRPHMRQVGPAKWEVDGRAHWFSSAELIRPWAAIIARAGLAAGTVPYALRHSSIVRGLRAGLPTRLVAATHDTSVGMIEAHYSAFVVDALDELAARAIVPLSPAGTVTPIRAA
jgi:integrase